MNKKRFIALILSLASLVSLFGGCSAGAIASPGANTTSISPARPAPAKKPLGTAQFGKLTYPKEYAEVAAVLSNLVSDRNSWNSGGGWKDMPEGSIADMAPADDGDAIADAPPLSAPAATAAPSPGEAEKDFSETNTQVKGIDEGDIVKTDGDYIYILRDNELIISLADGAGTKIVSRTMVAENNNGGNRLSGTDKYSQELYISADRLAVVSSAYSWDTRAADIYGYYSNTDKTTLDIYDISNKQSPKLVTESGQDGYFTASRMMDGTIYLITNHNVWSIDNDKPETFVPSLYRDGEGELVAPGCIVICPPYNNTSYTVISTYDFKTGEIKSNQSVLGGGNTVYMNGKNLYVTRSEYNEEILPPYIEDQYKVTEYATRTTTLINRFSLADGKVALSATGTINGSLLNQFSLDEYKGSLRVVTTEDNYSYKIYEDEKRGWSYYEHVEDCKSNSLYVLNPSLDVIGSITGLGEDERVYSVRFDGDIGYFVTFRETDPLFTVDLSNPANPKVLSALKIPGFSQYLHVYGDGRLFGLGMDADPNTGRTDGMKLSMFDTSNKSDVTEKHSLKLDSYYSEALYNHKAILIAPDKDLIAFPTDGGYDVYGYSDERGFYKRASIKGSEDWWDSNMRGLYIDDYAYVCGAGGISVFNMSDFTGVTSIKF